ncbi:MAG: enterochelin esterase [Gemmatimonadetes bacterium]|nr:enterochelin esterase [Gemmatimonadota bacterium]
MTHPGVSDQDIDRFIEGHEFPIVEGRFCTFVYRGEADAVSLRHWVYGLETSREFTRVGDTDLWYYVLELPPESRVEYKFEVRRGRRRRLVEDPLNPHKAADPFGANSVCHSAGYEVPEWTRPDPWVRQGRLEERRVASQALGGSRRVTVYLPARYGPNRKHPLLVVHDGADYLRFADLKIVLDNLIHRQEVPPLVVALTHPEDRNTEYVANEDHGRFIADELLPAMESEFNLVAGPDGRGLMGASLGGIATFSTAARHPQAFGRLLIQSTSFAFTDIGKPSGGPIFEPIVRFVNDYRSDPRRVTEKLFMTCGQYEPLIYENRSMFPLLQGAGMEVRYVEARDGHNWQNWRDRLREGLSWLFPGPMWFVYE